MQHKARPRRALLLVGVSFTGSSIPKKRINNIEQYRCGVTVKTLITKTTMPDIAQNSVGKILLVSIPIALFYTISCFVWQILELGNV